MDQLNFKRWALRSVIALVPIAYVASCSYNSYRGNAAMAQIKNGDSERQVIALFGLPTTRERQNASYPRYVNDKCIDPCVERLWFQNKLSIADEAWFVTVDKDRRVLDSAHLISP